MKKVSIFLLQLIIGISSHAQITTIKSNATEYPWQLGIGVGYTNYYGDVSNYRIQKFSDIGKIYHFADFNHYYIPSPSFSLMLEKKLNPTLGFMLQFNQVSFAMGDRYRNKSGSVDPNAMNFARSLNFKTNLHDAGFALTFSAANGHTFKENSFFYPSFYVGGGVAMFNVYGDLYDDNGNPYNYKQAGNVNDGHYETNLRDLKTETLNRYSNIVPYLDLGLALNFRLNNTLTLSLQSDIKYAGTDYLDDVSGQYKSSYPSAAASYAAHPGYNVVDPVTLQRGDMNDVNDMYINNRLVLHINLSQKKKKTVFKAPTVYSLTYAPRASFKDSAAVYGHRSMSTNGINNEITDTMVTRLDSTPIRRADTAYQHLVENRLDSIQHQLKGIKTVIRNQAFEARYSYLHFKQDSVKQLKKNIQGQRVITREDNLKMRIYDLQLDSLHNEMQLLQRRAESGMEDNDSSWKQSAIYFYRMPAAVTTISTDSIKAVVPVRQLPADSISDQQLLELSNSFAAIKKDKRYSKDSAYRSTIDSLNKKMAQYEIEKTRQATGDKIKDSVNKGVNMRGGVKPAADSNISNNKTNTDMMADSLQKDSATIKRDSVTINNSLRSMEMRVKQSNDSLKTLQAAVKQSRDSASYYSRMAFAAKTTADSIDKQPKKWYQRIIPGKSKKVAQANETAAQRIDEREQYYNTQLSELNSRVNDVQRRNKDLTQEYDRNRTHRDETVYRAAPATVIRETTNSRRDNNDLHDLRNEISALRNQLILQQAVETGVNNRNNNPRKTVSDTVYIRTPVKDSSRQQPAVNPQMLAMQQEIARLKTEMENMKTPMVKPALTPVAVKEKMEELTVYFGLGSSTLTGAQLNKFSAYGKKLAASNPGTLLLTGYTDAVGNAAVNSALAKKRMAYVQQLLVTRFDIPVDNIHLEEPVTEEAGGNKKNALNRKVTVKPE